MLHERLVSRERPAAAADLLPIEALSEDGLLVRSDRALVRMLEVLPRNPLVLDEVGLERLTAGFGQLLARLPAHGHLQLIAHATPVALSALLEQWRGDAARATADLQEGVRLDREARDALRRLAEVHAESLTVHAGEQAAVRLRFLVVVPHSDRAGQPLVRPRRTHQRLARELLALCDGVRSDLEGLELPARLLDGPEMAALLVARCAPEQAARQPDRPLAPLLADPAGFVDLGAARRAATCLREGLCQAGIDLSDPRRLRVDGGLEQTLHLQGVPEATFFGWTLHAMQHALPWTLAVHVHATDRVLERRRLRQRYRRLYGVNRGAEAAGRVPDFDQQRSEDEVAGLVQELAASSAGLVDLSLYLNLRCPGPDPDAELLADAVDAAVRDVAGAVDAKLARGEFAQAALWQSTLPLGLDVARRTVRLVSRNAADTLPLVSTQCGSPSGLHLGYADPGRTLERLDPFDPLHDNGTLIVNGKSGGGKTFAVLAMLQQALALGAQAAVIDRSAGHYAFLCGLLPGARHVQVGLDEDTVNPWDCDDPRHPSGQKVAFLVRLHALLVGDHHADSDAFGLDPLERNLLELAIRGAYRRATDRGEPARESLLAQELRDRARTEAASPEGSGEVAAVYRSLAERLHQFCAGGSYGALLDRPTSVDLASAPLVVFDTRRVPEDVSPAVLFALSEHVTAHIDRRRERYLRAGAGEGMFAGRFVLVLEELWKLVERRATGQWLNEQARRARHSGLFLVCVTQQRSDLAGPYGKALLDNSTMQLLLRQSPDELAYLADALRLTREEVAQIAQLKTDKGRAAQAFFINGTRGRGVVSIRLGPQAYWIATSDPVADQPAREAALRDADGDGWEALQRLTT